MTDWVETAGTFTDVFLAELTRPTGADGQDSESSS